MDDAATSPAGRIEKAVARIKDAVAGHLAAHDTLTARNAALRARMAEAVAALDAVLHREDSR